MQIKLYFVIEIPDSDNEEDNPILNKIINDPEYIINPEFEYQVIDLEIK
jgi:hypothetical protein